MVVVPGTWSGSTCQASTLVTSPVRWSIPTTRRAALAPSRAVKRSAYVDRRGRGGGSISG